MNPLELRKWQTVVAAISRHRRPVGLCMAICALLSLAVIASLPVCYRAEASVLIGPEATPAVSRDMARQVMARLHLGDESDLSRPCATESWWRLWDFASMSGQLPPRTEDQRIDSFLSHIETSLLDGSSSVLRIRASSKDPHQAVEIANALATTPPIGGKFIAPATLPARQSHAMQILILFLGSTDGLLLGVVAALSSDYLQNNFRRAEDIESASGLKVIALVPRLAENGSAITHVLREPFSPYSRSLRKLYDGLKETAWGNPARTVAVGSTVPAEGRSILIASLGRLLAGDGLRILLIDCDWRKPELHHLFEISNEPGLAALLINDELSLEQAIHADPLSGLDVMTGGRWSRRSVDRLASERMRGLLAALAEAYDLVLLDLPPLQAADDVILLTRMVDKVVFAVRWRQTKLAAALRALDRIMRAQGEVAGIVFTQVDREIG